MASSHLLSRPVEYIDPSNTDIELWNHPMLDIFRKAEAYCERPPILYSVPTSFGEEYDPDFAPQPTSAKNLPNLQEWTMRFALSVLEIWAAKRQPAQLARWCHHSIYQDLIKNVGSQKIVGRIRKVYECQPFDGICETTLTVRFNDRVRSLVIRFEGVDNRWLCTALTLL